MKILKHRRTRKLFIVSLSTILIVLGFLLIFTVEAITIRALIVIILKAFGVVLFISGFVILKETFDYTNKP